MSKTSETRVILRDPNPNRFITIAHVVPPSPQEGDWQALYFENQQPIYKHIEAWCGVTDADGRYLDGYKTSHTLFGLVIVGNRLEICDTHTDFIAYVQNPDARLIRDLIHEWSMANNQ